MVHDYPQSQLMIVHCYYCFWLINLAVAIMKHMPPYLMVDISRCNSC